MYDRQELIYSAPLMHQDYLVYPGYIHDTFALASSVSTHYQHYPKLVLHMLSEEQFEFAFASVLPNWQLTHLSLQTLSPATISKVISTVNFTFIKQLILVDLDPDCLRDIYYKLSSLTLGRPQVIKVICPNNSEWQDNFNSLFANKPVTNRYIEYIKTENAYLSTQLEDLQKNRLTRSNLVLTQQKEQYEKQLSEYEKQIEKLKAELLRNKESARIKILAAEDAYKKALVKIDNAESIYDKKSKALIKALEAFEKQKLELQEIHSTNDILKKTIHSQRELRIRDRKIYQREIRNIPIVCEAIHTALIKKEVNSKKRRYSSDSSSSSSDGTVSEASDSTHSSTASEYSPTFFSIRLRKTGTCPDAYVLLKP